MHHCTICPRQLRPDEDREGLHACHTCTHRIRGWLAELPHQHAALQDCLQPGGQPAQGRIGGRAHSPAPLRLDALSLLGPGSVAARDTHGDQAGLLPIHTWLTDWAHYIATQHPSAHRDTHGTIRINPCTGAHPRGTTTAAWCAWLTAYTPYAVRQPWIGEFHRQLGTLITATRDITRLTPQRHPRDAPCPNCRAFALGRTDGEWEITCGRCRHRLDPAAYDAHAAHAAHVHAAHTPRPTHPDPETAP